MTNGVSSLQLISLVSCLSLPCHETIAEQSLEPYSGELESRLQSYQTWKEKPPRSRARETSKRLETLLSSGERDNETPARRRRRRGGVVGSVIWQLRNHVERTTGSVCVGDVFQLSLLVSSTKYLDFILHNLQLQRAAWQFADTPAIVRVSFDSR